jgi:hypothetical protein
MNFMQKHVEALNAIYSGLQFFNQDKSKYYVGVKFVIRRTKVKNKNKKESILFDFCKVF